MSLLFEMDFKYYNPSWKIVTRPSATAIIIKDNKIYLIHSMKYDYYEFSGGGIEKDERFVLELVDINTVINVNRNNNHGPENLIIIDRDTKVLEMAVEYLKK